MKKFIRLVFFGLFLFLGYKYLESNDIEIKDRIAEGKEWLTEQFEEIQPSTTGEEPPARPMEQTTRESLNISNAPSTDRHYQPATESSNNARIQSSQTRTYTDTVSTRKPREEKPDASEQVSSFKTPIGNLPENNSDWVKAVTELYSPNSWNLLMKYEKLPYTSEAPLTDGGITTSNKPVETFHYLNGTSRTDLLSSMETNVHELAHAYFRQNSYKYANENNILLDWDKAEGFVYISPSNTHFVSCSNKLLFPSRNLASVIPGHLRTFRYDTYIEGSTSTQSEGVIGLLNELHAYYLGSRYCYDMLDAYQNAMESDAGGMLEWVTNAMSTMTAFYEFDFFIKEYLLYMKNNHPAAYSEMNDNLSFKQAYNAICNSYEQLTRDYQVLIQSEMQRINATGTADVSIRGNQLWVKPSNSTSSSGTPIFSEDRNKLAEVLASGRFLEIERDFL